MAGPPSIIVNGDFENGLAGWHAVSGKAFLGQPVAAANVGAGDTQIRGSAPVPLGGNYWQTTTYPVGHNGDHLIRAITKAPGILDSDKFMVSARFLAYRLGGSKDKGAAIELRVAPASATKAGFKVLDKPDADGFVAVRLAYPSGSDVMQEAVWDLGKGLLGEVAKVRLRLDAGASGVRRLLVDDIRMEAKRPRRFRPPVWGWADIHCHPMAQAGFGELLHGHIHGPVEDLGSCLEVHGYEHQNVLHPASMELEGRRHNDGSLATSGWTTGTPGPEDELGFRGWPTFNEKTHVKTHQDWVRRAWEGGQRLMVALIVHNQLLASISTGSKLLFEAQSDRDTVEPQIQILLEFVAHNADWCGLATSPDEARNLIEANKMAFVLGLETDSINDWVKDTDLAPDPMNPDPTGIHAMIHDYFAYLRRLGVVQVNLIHLSDNAFGGMALYDRMFVINSLLRRGVMPSTEDGWAPHANNPDERISAPVDLASFVWEKLEPVAQQLGITWPAMPGSGTYGHGDRNAHGLTPAGKVALVEAMRLGMVVDMDHMSEHSVDDAFAIATNNGPKPGYPLISAHNGARALAPRAPATLPTATDVPAVGERRNPKVWPSESMKSETQLDRIKTLMGMFGHGIAGMDSLPHGMVVNDCPGTSKTVAQGLEYIAIQKELPVAFGTDWNVLLDGPGPRFGPMAAIGVLGELAPNDAWATEVRTKRLQDVTAQSNSVTYDTPIRDWHSHRFTDSGLYDDKAYRDAGRFIWQALALEATHVDLTSQAVIDSLQEPGLGQPALDLALGLTNGPGDANATFFKAGRKARDATFAIIGTPTEIQRVMDLVDGVHDIEPVWIAATSPGAAPPLVRSTAGPVRDFDYNLDGLAHYGMLPDMLQDLKNVSLPQGVLDNLFGSAEAYLQIWERCLSAAATIPHPAPGVGP